MSLLKSSSYLTFFHQHDFLEHYKNIKQIPLIYLQHSITLNRGKQLVKYGKIQNYY